MAHEDSRLGLEVRPRAILRLTRFMCLPEEPTPYPLGIAILGLQRSPVEGKIRLQGQTVQKCPYCGLVHEAIEAYIEIDLSGLTCACGSNDQRVVLTRIQAIDKESMTYEFEAEIICRQCNRVWPRIRRKLDRVFSNVKRLHISGVKGEAEVEFKDREGD